MSQVILGKSRDNLDISYVYSWVKYLGLSLECLCIFSKVYSGVCNCDTLFFRHNCAAYAQILCLFFADLIPYLGFDTTGINLVLQVIKRLARIYVTLIAALPTSL